MTDALQHSESSQIADRTSKLPLLVLLVFSIAFAFYNSNSSYTSDEVWSVKTAGLSYGPRVEALKADVHPPLYFHILSAHIKLLGSNERATRALSALFYVLAAFSVFGLAKQLYGSKTALLAAALFLTSPLAILSAQFVRMYSLLSLLAILSTWFFLYFSVKPRDSYLLSAGFVAVNILGTFTHIAFFFLLCGQFLFHLTTYRWTRLRRLIIAIAISVVPYFLVWFPVLLRQVGNSKEGLAWVKKPGLSMLLDLLLVYGGAFWLVLPVLVYVILRAGVRPWRNWSKLSDVKFSLYLLAFTILPPLLFSFAKPIFNSRLAIVGLHLFALTVAGLIKERWNYLLPVSLVVLCLILMTVFQLGSSSCDNRQMAHHLNATANDNDVIVFTSLTRLPIDYYLDRLPDRKKLVETSFPAEIDQHPGYEGRLTDPARRELLEREARELVERIVTNGNANTRVFFLHGTHPEVDSLFEDQLRSQAETIADLKIECTDAASYFKQMDVYRLVGK